MDDSIGKRRKWQGTKNWDLEGRGIPANSFCPSWRQGRRRAGGQVRRTHRPAGRPAGLFDITSSELRARTPPLLPYPSPSNPPSPPPRLPSRGTRNRPCLTTAMHHDRSLPLANLCSPLFLFSFSLCSGGGVQENWCRGSRFRTRQEVNSYYWRQLNEKGDENYMYIYMCSGEESLVLLLSITIAVTRVPRGEL